MVEELRREYGARRFRVIELVFSRSDPAESFAGAFSNVEKPPRTPT